MKENNRTDCGLFVVETFAGLGRYAACVGSRLPTNYRRVLVAGYLQTINTHSSAPS